MREISSGAGWKKEQWLSSGYFCWKDKKSKEGYEWVYSEAAVFAREMSSVIALWSVLIQWELIPRGELIRSEQKKRARRRPILDLQQAPVVQLNADALSVTLRSTGYGSLVGFLVRTVWRAAQ
jgi:hypothetical protein